MAGGQHQHPPARPGGAEHGGEAIDLQRRLGHVVEVGVGGDEVALEFSAPVDGQGATGSVVPLGDGHTEVVEISYDTEKTSVKKILDFFFQIHNPTTINQQGNDRGISYRSVIFYNNEDEKKEALDFIDIVNASKRWPNPVVTTVEPFTFYTKAEDYHQDYFEQHPHQGYCAFVVGPKVEKFVKTFKRLLKD